MRLRIIVVMVLGAAVLGFFGFNFLGPAHPEGAVTIFGGNITIIDTAIYAALCFLVTIAAYLLSCPYGRQIAPLAVATGLSVVACRSGEMMTLVNINHKLTQRVAMYSVLKWEGFYWLLPLLSAWCGLLIAQRLIKHSRPDTVPPAEAEQLSNHSLNNKLAIVVAVIATIVIANFTIGIFAQDVRMFDRQVGSVVGQPSTSQIAFAVITAFAIASFVVKRFLGLNYLVCSVSASLLTLFAIITCARGDVLEHMSSSWPAAFYSRAIISVLPIQMVAFGTLGSIIGYWWAVRYMCWRRCAKTG